MKLNLQLLTAAVLSIEGLVLLFCGVYIDPQGQIHETLLIGFGEVATFAGALFGIDYVYKQKKWSNRKRTIDGLFYRDNQKNKKNTLDSNSTVST